MMQSNSEPAPRPGVCSFWLIPLAILLAALIVAGVWSFLLETRPSRSLLPTATAIITVLPASSPSPLAASATPAATPVPPTPVPPTPDAAAPPAGYPPAPSGGITVGGLVEVVGTGGDGLRLRAGPGLDQTVNLLALDSEVFRVDDGPQESDGFTWWHLTDLRNPAREGWAVVNYLQVVQGS